MADRKLVGFVVGPGPRRSRKVNAPIRNRTENLLIKSLTRAVSDRQGTPGSASSRQPRVEGRPQSPVPVPFSLEVPQFVTHAHGDAPRSAAGRDYARILFSASLTLVCTMMRMGVALQS